MYIHNVNCVCNVITSNLNHDGQNTLAVIMFIGNLKHGDRPPVGQILVKLARNKHAFISYLQF